MTMTPGTNFPSPNQGRLHMKLAFNRHNGFTEDVWKMLTGDRISVTLNKDQIIILTFGNKISSFANLVKHIYQTWYLRKIVCENHYLSIFAYKSITYHSWPCHGLGQGQPMVIICIKYDELVSSILHAKFEGHQSFGSGGEFYEEFLPCMDVATILVKWPRHKEQTFTLPTHIGSTWVLTSIGQWFQKRCLKTKC